MSGIFLVLAGIFTVALAYSNTDWYFETSKAKLWSTIFGGRENARVALIVVGGLLAFAGFFVR